MPALALLLNGLLTGLTTLISTIFGIWLAVRLASFAAFLAFAALLVAAFNMLVAPLAAQVFSTSWGMVLGLAFPPVAGTCLAALAACWSACSLYAMQRRALAVVGG